MHKGFINLAETIERLRKNLAKTLFDIGAEGLYLANTDTPPQAIVIPSSNTCRECGLHPINMEDVNLWQLSMNGEAASLSVPLNANGQNAMLKIALGNGTVLRNFSPAQFVYMPEGIVRDTEFCGYWRQRDGKVFDGTFVNGEAPFTSSPAMLANDCSFTLHVEDRAYSLWKRVRATDFPV